MVNFVINSDLDMTDSRHFLNKQVVTLRECVTLLRDRGKTIHRIIGQICTSLAFKKIFK